MPERNYPVGSFTGRRPLQPPGGWSSLSLEFDPSPLPAPPPSAALNSPGYPAPPGTSGSRLSYCSASPSTPPGGFTSISLAWDPVPARPPPSAAASTSTAGPVSAGVEQLLGRTSPQPQYQPANCYGQPPEAPAGRYSPPPGTGNCYSQPAESARYSPPPPATAYYYSQQGAAEVGPGQYSSSPPPPGTASCYSCGRSYSPTSQLPWGEGAADAYAAPNSMMGQLSGGQGGGAYNAPDAWYSSSSGNGQYGSGQGPQQQQQPPATAAVSGRFSPEFQHMVQDRLQQQQQQDAWCAQQQQQQQWQMAQGMPPPEVYSASGGPPGTGYSSSSWAVAGRLPMGSMGAAVSSYNSSGAGGARYAPPAALPAAPGQYSTPPSRPLPSPCGSISNSSSGQRLMTAAAHVGPLARGVVTPGVRPGVTGASYAGDASAAVGGAGALSSRAAAVKGWQAGMGRSFDAGAAAVGSRPGGYLTAGSSDDYSNAGSLAEPGSAMAAAIAAGQQLGFQAKKGQFCGKICVQPPGGRSNLNLFG